METTDQPKGIRPAVDTLRALDGGQFLDKLAAAIHEATNAVTTYNRSGKIVVRVTVAPFTKGQLTEPAITMKAKIELDLPEADDRTQLFFVDLAGNPSTQQQRQRDLGLSVAGAVTTNDDHEGRVAQS